MKRLLLPLLAALALPTAANADIFPNLKTQPQNFNEWFHIGVISGSGGKLCTMWVAGDLTFERAKYYRDGMFKGYKKEGERGKEVFIAGFNQGIESMKKLPNNDPKYATLKNKFDKCDKLKIK